MGVIPKQLVKNASTPSIRLLDSIYKPPSEIIDFNE